MSSRTASSLLSAQAESDLGTSRNAKVPSGLLPFQVSASTRSFPLTLHPHVAAPYPLLGRVDYKNSHTTTTLSWRVALLHIFFFLNWKKRCSADRGSSLSSFHAIWHFYKVSVSRILYKDLSSHVKNDS